MGEGGGGWEKVERTNTTVVFSTPAVQFCAVDILFGS